MDIAKIFDTLLNSVDPIIVGLVVLSGLFQKNFLKYWKLSKDDSYNSALKTLIVSAAVSIIYIFLLKDPDKASNWAKYFISYFTATSLYELLLSKLFDWIGGFFKPKT